MANIRAQVVFQGFSGLPEDRFVNTWHFSNGQAFSTHIAGVEATLDAFYEEANAGGELLNEFITPAVLLTYEYRLYDLSQPPPRIPVVLLKSRSGPAATLGFPEELAIVCTLEGAPPVTARRRGRLYFGPLANLNTITSAQASNYSSVHVNILQHLKEALEAAKTASLASLSGWAIRSSVPAENFVTVVGGFIDSAVDIQRRRGPDATSRVTWGA